MMSKSMRDTDSGGSRWIAVNEVYFVNSKAIIRRSDVYYVSYYVVIACLM